MSRLTGPELAVVEIAAVVPTRLDVSMLDAIDPDLVGALDAAVQSGLLEIRSGSVAFRHELARAAVEQALTPARRRAAHRQVLSAGERLGADAARLAHHARSAGDVDAMIRILPAAAAEAAARQSHREAATHLRALVPHLDLLPPGDRVVLLTMCSEQVDAADGDGLAMALRAVAVSREIGEPRAEGHALIAASRAAWARSEWARAADLAEEAARVLVHVPGEDLAAAHALLARHAVQSLDDAAASAHARRALELAPGPNPARAVALTALGTLRNFADYPSGTPMLDDAVEVADSLGLAWEAQRARANLIETAAAAMDLDRARRLNEVEVRRTEAEPEVGAHRRWFAVMGSVLAGRRGDLARSLADLRRWMDDDASPEALRWWCRAESALLLVRSGDHAAASAVEDLWERTSTDGQAQDRLWAARVSAEHRWVFGRTDPAGRARDLEVLARYRDVHEVWAVGQLALALLMDGVLDALPTSAPAPLQWIAGGRWRRAADWFGERGAPFEQATALARGDVAARIEGLRVAQRIGARALAARVRSGLVADGVTTIPRGPRAATRGDVHGLTRRQQEVLALVTEGLSNAAIAERLFISVRTAENHVAAVLGALGVGTREAAAELTRREGRGAGARDRPARAPGTAAP
ncbi:LuxR C-terminal-related transcriptional regulator [Agromyces sp. SYSU T0242]|uniref:LuxR C-terminal-related transcriptional regulator n=1 Tax=Agromyces litoreus TaxID=3158561 RepID=UPI003398CAF8